MDNILNINLTDEDNDKIIKTLGKTHYNFVTTQYEKKTDIKRIINTLINKEISAILIQFEANGKYAQLLNTIKENSLTSNIPKVVVLPAAAAAAGLLSATEETALIEFEIFDFIFSPFDFLLVKLRLNNAIRQYKLIKSYKKLSTTDQLTNIPNRRSLTEYINFVWENSIRNRLSVGFILLDIDHFKKYNDIYGHDKGDICLANFAQILKRSIKRKTDFVARIGGEEFCVLLPGSDLENTKIVAENFRSKIESSIIDTIDGKDIQITASLGINAYVPHLGSEYSDIIKTADIALYKAKEKGRNRVEHFKKSYIKQEYKKKIEDDEIEYLLDNIIFG